MSTKLRSLPLLVPATGWVFGLVLARSDAISLPVSLVLVCCAFILSIRWRMPLFITFFLALVYGLTSFVLDVQRVTVGSDWLDKRLEISAIIEDVSFSKQYTKLRLRDVFKTNGDSLAGFADVYLYRNKQILMPDMSIQAHVKFHLPRNKLNPDTFDYEQYAFSQHVAVIGSVSGEVAIIAQDISWLTFLRQQIRQALQPLNEQVKGVLLALLLADRSRIPLNIDDAFSANGATHLLAISGLHMGLVAGWGVILAWWFITRHEAWIVNMPVRLVSLTAGVCLAMMYATLAGWPIPAQRAFLMMVAGVIAWWLKGSQVPLNTMLFALFLITATDSASVLSVSLWLSFTATSALLIWAQSQPTTGSVWLSSWMWLKGMFWVSVIASIATLPLIGFVFERLPVWSLLANMVSVPIYAVWVLPFALLGEMLALVGLVDVAYVILTFSAHGISWVNTLLLSIQTWPAGSVWLRGDLFWVYGLFFLFLCMSGFLFYLKKRRKAIVLLALTLVSYVGVMIDESSVENPNLYVWDVGQGASAMLRTPSFNLLLDVPGKWGSKFNGGTIAAENARDLGLLHLDALVLSHAQSDHAGGLSRLLASLNEVEELWLADVPANREYYVFQQVQEKMEIHWLKRGDEIKQQGVKVQVLWPPENHDPSNSNNTSLVLLVTLETGQTILLPGDMEKEVEQEIFAELGLVDVLLMPHHGSKTSSTDLFVKQVKPKIAIAQTGYQNSYGFPKEEVVKRYKDAGCQVLDTSKGAINITFKGNELETLQYASAATSKRKEIEHWLSIPHI